MRARDRALGILLGILLGVAIVVVFVFVFSGETIDEPEISGGGGAQPQVTTLTEPGAEPEAPPDQGPAGQP